MPFHGATENMAALLRSARLLKFSPSGLLQITGTKRNGPTLSRLYSGALGGKGTGVCSRKISPASGNASSRVWPYAVGCVRNYAVATEQKDEASVAVRSKQAQQFDWALAKLDSSVRRTGRITKTLLLRIFHDICRTGYPSGNQALLLLRSCGSLLPEVPLEERSELAHRVWEKLQELGAQYDVSHYNALLKVYLQNEFKFSPTDFLAKMELANVQPNRVTYQRLIAAYCQNGDIEGASTILGFMKSKDLPITEAVFNSLVTGHACAGDIESAKNILSVMRAAGIEPGPDTYFALLNAYAAKGDLDSLKKTMEAADSADCSVMDRDVMQVIFTLAKAGHQQHIPEMVERLRHERGYVPDAMNLCLSLITQSQEDTAFHILKTFPTLQSESFNTESANLGNFFLRHCVNMDTSLEKIGRYCKELQESNLHTAALSFTLSCALEAKKLGMSLELMKMLKKQDFPIRPHYFWPLLTQHVKDSNTAGVVEVVKGMQELEVCPDVETLSNYILPVFPSTEAARQALKDAGISLESEGFLSSEVRSVAVSNLAELYTILSDPSCPSLDLSIFRGSLILGFRKSSDVESMVKVRCQCAHIVERLLHIVVATAQVDEGGIAGNRHLLLVLLLQLKECGFVFLLTEAAFGLEYGWMDGIPITTIVEEAVDILKEMKEKEVVMNDTHVTMLFHTLNSVVAKGGAPTIRRLQDTIFTLGLAKPTANLCSPLITAYLDSKDLSGALEAALECQKRYNHLPRIHDIVVALVENGDTELLQKAMDFVSQERGEMTMLYDLFFAFLQTGRYREARKIIETPGLRARPGRLHWYAEKCISSKQMEALEQMVDMTAKLFECDRDEMYSYILRLCKETNDWQKAEAVWTKMQEDNVIPRERTLHMLADVLKNNGQEVPFEVPETWYQQPATTQQVKSATTLPTVESGAEYQARLLALCKRGKAKEAYGMLKEVDKKGVALGPAPYDQLIRALLAEGSIEDAMAVKDIAASHVPGFQLSDIATNLLIITHSKKGQAKDALEKLKSMLQVDQVPSQLAVTRLVQALGSDGDVAGIQEVESLMKGLGTTLNLSSMVFVNNTALAHIKNGDMESAVEVLEAVFTSPNSTNPSMSFVFRKILEDDNDKALDKLSAMAERLANHFGCYRPASDLFLQLLDMDKVEDAKFMLARCNALAEQKEVLVSYLSQKAQRPGQVGKIKALLSLIPDFTEKEVVYPYLMKCHVLDKDLLSAKALQEQMQKGGTVIDELSLKRLAALYRNAGETVPFVEPPESFKFYADKLKERAAKAKTTIEA
ncbi:leucine-rich PPR motif-containing protein, mitochondrial [Etheostoma cragini]|uniref:leucine-rich PPR motif-containing protein, mitochondrial n=1 Tax=Etheostoma cragini TaxID=417921 RepID=UPI00155F2956|nr:leucine-rich PPR motif-containing protein, mitochondrial [Etheostoma cragini]